MNIGEHGRLKRIYEGQAFNDITLYYSRLTEFLGFTPVQDEGKVMGLAGYSENFNALEEAQTLLRAENGGFRGRNLFFSFSGDKAIFRKLKTRPREEIAASFQFHAENTVCAIIDYWVRKTGISAVALSGGFFANIKVNQKIAELGSVSQLYIYPHMGDGGSALGAVYSLLKTEPFRLKDVFFGTAYSDSEIKRVLDEDGLKYEQCDNIEKEIALLLSRGKIVARFCGAMEYGPRALGNRSILAPAGDPKVNEVLNQKLGRDDFMPFAPSILAEYADKCCNGTQKAEYSAAFMNISFSCTDYFAQKCPGAVHRDGTTRPQLVREKDNPGFYRILNYYNEYTGIPALINTSFNVHEDPIVRSPEDAVRAFKKADLEYLSIGNFLVKGEIDEKKKNKKNT